MDPDAVVCVRLMRDGGGMMELVMFSLPEVMVGGVGMVVTTLALTGLGR
jgi:uracil phosphoribosyltransferase